MTAPLILHGVVPADAPSPPDAPAHRRAPLPGAPGLDALLSPLALDETGAAPAKEALRHHAILAAYAGTGDVAPARFGCAVAREADLDGLLAVAAAPHAAALKRVAGCVEFGARVVAEEAPTGTAPDAPASGRDYLRARRDARRLREAAGAARRAALLEAEGGLAARAREAARLRSRAPAEGPKRLLELGLLVPRAEADGFRAAARAVARRLAPLGLALTLTGPWPPYSFAAPETPEDAA